MKKILLTTMLLVITNWLIAQTGCFNKDLWCINLIETQVDSNTQKPYTLVHLSNTDTLLIDSLQGLIFIGISAITSNTDTIRKYNNLDAHHGMPIYNTSMTLRFDTVINLPITALEIWRGNGGCGIDWSCASYFNNFCSCYNCVPSAINTMATPNPLVILPNPSSGIIKIKNLIELNNKVQIIAYNGAVIFERVIGKDDEIDLSSMAKGIYIIRIKDKYAKFQLN
jgi:hypothetical protein